MYGKTLEREDIVLLQVLLRDSRASPEQIAEVTGLRPGDIPEMVARMREAGVIGDMTAKPSLRSLDTRSVLVYGRSRLGSLRNMRRGLQGNENVAWMAWASGGTAYMALHLKKDLDDGAQVRKAASQAMMVQPRSMTRDLFDHGLGRHEFTNDDMRIIRSLYRDSNKDLGEVAMETGLSRRTVESRFQEMAGRGALDFSVDFFPDHCDNLLTMLRLEVVERRGMEEGVAWLMEANAPYIMFFNTFSDHPRTLTSMIIPESMGALRAILRNFEDSGAFGSVEADLLIGSTIVPSWRDRLLGGLDRDIGQ